jgi:hypothetical protein
MFALAKTSDKGIFLYCARSSPVSPILADTNAIFCAIFIFFIGLTRARIRYTCFVLRHKRHDYSSAVSFMPLADFPHEQAGLLRTKSPAKTYTITQ